MTHPIAPEKTREPFAGDQNAGLSSARENSASSATTKDSFFGHPRGLAYLAFTEAWERFSFSGMQSLLVLYMVHQLLQPGSIEHVYGFENFRWAVEFVYGPLAPQPLSSVVFGLYTSLVFFMPVFGGILGDRKFGQHSMVMAGAIFMAIGHFMMAFEASFLLALLMLILGSGCLKGNITTQVGSLYSDTDRRRGDGFQIFQAGLNAGILLAPLICGTLGEVYGWHYGFGAAGVGMLIGLVIYIAGKRHLPPDRLLSEPVDRAPLMPQDGRLVLLLLLVFVAVTSFLTGAGQLGNVYNLWLKDYADRSMFGLTIPVTWFHILTPLLSLLFMPPLVKTWQEMYKRGTEPSLLAKMGIGLGLTTLAMLSLATLAYFAQTTGKVRWEWVMVMHVLLTMGYLFVYPVGLALFSSAAPRGTRATFIAIFFMSSFLASNIVGWLGRYYSTMSPAEFWLMHAAIPGCGALLVMLLARPLGKAALPS